MYRYYVPIGRQTGRRYDTPSLRLPAERLEARLRALLSPIAPSADCTLSVADRVTVCPDSLAITLSSIHRTAVHRMLEAGHALDFVDEKSICWTVPSALPSKEVASERTTLTVNRDPTLIRALRAAHAMLDHDRRGQPILRNVPGPRYDRRLARLAFLSPALQAAIVAGKQPSTLTLEKIVRGHLPIAWEEQERWAARLT